MQLKTRGIILKSMDYKEKDRIVWLFTEDEGRLSVLCRGVKSPKSRYQSLIRPMVYGVFSLYQGKGMHILNEGEVMKGFRTLLEDLTLYTYATYFMELVDISVQDQEPSPFLYRNLLTALYLLETGALDPALLTLAYEVKHIHHTGFSVGAEAVPFKISKASENAMQFLLRSELDKVHVLKPSEAVVKEMQAVTEHIIKDSYQRRPKSLDMLKFV